MVVASGGAGGGDAVGGGDGDGGGALSSIRTIVLVTRFPAIPRGHRMGKAAAPS